MEALALESAAMQMLDVAKVAKLRRAAGWSQAEAARRAGLKPARWNDLESGRRKNVTLETLYTLARVLGCEAGELLISLKPGPKPKKGAK